MRFQINNQNVAAGTTMLQEHFGLALGAYWFGIQYAIGWHFGNFGLALGTLNPQNEISNKQSKCGGRDNNATGILWADRHWEHIGLAFGLLGIGNTGQAFGKLNSENEIPTKKIKMWHQGQHCHKNTGLAFRAYWVGIQNALP
jgi:hypothetical protein